MAEMDGGQAAKIVIGVFASELARIWSAATRKPPTLFSFSSR